MAIKKSDLYSSLWASCDELCGGMDASQYKDYVLFMLFIKHVSDKYGGSDDFTSPVTIPPGASVKDMVALKCKSDIGDKINTQVIQPLSDANIRLARSDFPDFSDPNKLGEGQAMVDRLSNLIGIFQKSELDFSKSRAENDDILAAEAGKHITLEGQDMDVTTAGLARMNMIPHDFPTANKQAMIQVLLTGKTRLV